MHLIGNIILILLIKCINFLTIKKTWEKIMNHIPVDLIIKIVVALAGFSGVILFLLNWRRFKPNDKAEVDKKNAETIKTMAEAEKTKAETEVSKAAAQKTFNDIAMGIITRLDEELEEEKLRNKELEERYRKLQDKLEDIVKEMRQVKLELEEETRACNKISQELKEAREELKKYKRDAEQ